jgi:hypothetical protein
MKREQIKRTDTIISNPENRISNPYMVLNPGDDEGFKTYRKKH